MRTAVSIEDFERVKRDQRLLKAIPVVGLVPADVLAALWERMPKGGALPKERIFAAGVALAVELMGKQAGKGADSV